MTIIILLISTLGSGILMIYAFNRPLFFELETVKLILLATSISTPIWAFNTFLIMYFEFADNNLDEVMYVNSIVGSFVTSLVFALPTIIAFLYPYEVKYAVIAIIVLQFLFLMALIYDKKVSGSQTH
ncbi:hypothetical protein [Echinicola rosea]|nr:hypothetical protein [Echinicola rosea]GGF51112.1 hypothetical protein GCM10011339_44590 [Echinicola rosea]